MIIGIDDSGSFEKEELGMFAAVYIRPKKRDKLERIFLDWESSLPDSCKDKGEVKGRLLSPEQVRDFADRILRKNNIYPIKFHVFATPTRGFNVKMIIGQRDKNIRQYEAAIADYRKDGEEYENIANEYTKLVQWLRKRSIKTLLKIELLGNTIFKAINDSITWSAVKDFDRELGKLDIKIDKAFIDKPEHMTYWLDIMRNMVWNLSYHGGGIIHLNTWNSHHPFIKRFNADPKSRSRLSRATPEFKKSWNFYDSKDHFEIRLEDIVANAYFRRFVLNEEALEDAIIELQKSNVNKPNTFTIVALQGESPTGTPNPYTDTVFGEQLNERKGE